MVALCVAVHFKTENLGLRFLKLKRIVLNLGVRNTLKVILKESISKSRKSLSRVLKCFFWDFHVRWLRLNFILEKNMQKNCIL